MQARKVRMSSGAQWLLDGFGLLRRSPLGLGLLGAIFGLIVVLPSLLVSQGAAAMVAQLLLIIAGPLLLGGLVWAVREVDAGRQARTGHLLQGLQDGKAPRLLATLLPQWIVLLLAAVLLVLLVGTGNLQTMQQLAETMQAGGQPDQALMQSLPFGRLMLWLLALLVLGIGAAFATFVAIPTIMFSNTGGIAAMRQSLRACARNTGAMIVFLVLLVIAAIGISLAAQLVGFIASLAGQKAMLLVVNVLLMAVLMPVYAGAAYSAWKQFFGHDGEGAVPALPQEHGFQA
ncbi:MAG: BPSS1780 family membrane protein [Pseudoxanthomonas suwonensis]|nr:BPSS1780 family membrane protein [Pseudoxanthomonas suwonensis]